MEALSPVNGLTIPLSTDYVLDMLHRFGTVMDFVGPHPAGVGNASAGPRSPSTSSASDHSPPPLSESPTPPYSDAVDDPEPLPSSRTLLRPVRPLSGDTMPVIVDNSPAECSLEQYVCFVYRGRAIWLRITVLMEDDGGEAATPHVEVRFVTEAQEEDPALRRIGLVIERGLQDGMRREILSAIRQAVNLRYLDPE